MNYVEKYCIHEKIDIFTEQTRRIAIIHSHFFFFKIFYFNHFLLEFCSSSECDLVYCSWDQDKLPNLLDVRYFFIWWSCLQNLPYSSNLLQDAEKERLFGARRGYRFDSRWFQGKSMFFSFEMMLAFLIVYFLCNNHSIRCTILFYFHSTYQITIFCSTSSLSRYSLLWFWFLLS